jgi:hypothetical protein
LKRDCASTPEKGLYVPLEICAESAARRICFLIKTTIDAHIKTEKHASKFPSQFQSHGFVLCMS